MDNSETYDRYLADKCLDIPSEVFRTVLKEMLRDAAFKLNTSVPDDIKEFSRQINWLIESKYKHLPLHKLKEAFVKGSLGELEGSTRLTIRNINIWIKNVSQSWNEGEIARRNREILDSTDISPWEQADPDSAAAYALRIGWGVSKRITHKQWDFLSSDDMHKKIIKAIKEHGEENVTPAMFLSGYVEPELPDQKHFLAGNF